MDAWIGDNFEVAKIFLKQGRKKLMENIKLKDVMHGMMNPEIHCIGPSSIKMYKFEPAPVALLY